MSTDRRAFLRHALTWPFLVTAAAALPACEAATADRPKAIKYGRDACEHCTMLISDPRFAAQVWNPDKKRFSLFDDVGCAVAYAVENGLADAPEARIWAADFEDPTSWLDTRVAFFRCGVHTPMDYGFVATRESAPDRVTFETMRDRVVKKAHCAPRKVLQGS